jgi:predicted translin family RNA/ssDNA-binding protein
MTLPQEKIERILQGSHEFAGDSKRQIMVLQRIAYQAGATSEATRALAREKVLVEALKQLLSRFPENPKSTWDKKAVLVARKALTNYAGEQGKGVGNG